MKVFLFESRLQIDQDFPALEDLSNHTDLSYIASPCGILEFSSVPFDCRIFDSSRSKEANADKRTEQDLLAARVSCLPESSRTRNAGLAAFLDSPETLGMVASGSTM